MGLYVMIEGRYPFEQENQIDHIFFQNPTTKYARELIGGLLQREPRERTPLEMCKRHPWPVLARIRPEVTTSPAMEEEHFRLLTDPINVSQLRTDLLQFPFRFKCAAMLVKREVVLCWGGPSAHTSCSYCRVMARECLADIIKKHCAHQDDFASNSCVTTVVAQPSGVGSNPVNTSNQHGMSKK